MGFFVNANKAPMVSACRNLHLKQASYHGRDLVSSKCLFLVSGSLEYNIYNLGMRKERENKDLKIALNKILQLATEV